MGSIDATKPIKPDSDFSFKDYLKKTVVDGVVPVVEGTEGLNDPTGLQLKGGAGDRAAIPDRYKSVSSGWSVFSNQADRERNAYLAQGGGAILKNALAGFGKQAAGGFLKAIASWDVNGLANMAMGKTEKQYGNWLDNVADGILKNSQENDVIFQKGDNSMMNTAYWANQFQSLGLTGGIIAEALAEQVAASFVLPGEGNAVALGNKARLLGSLGRQFAHGSLKGIQEAYTNALDTQGQVYQKYLDLGYGDDVAKKKSAEAASLNFRAETIPLMVLNGLQFAGTFGAGTKLTSAFGAGERAGLNSGFSGGAETLIDAVLPEVKNKFAKGAIGFGANAFSEALEEGIQTGVSKYAEHQTLKSTGDAKGELDLFNDSEMRDSMIGGAFGGALFSAIGKAISPLIKGTNAKRLDFVHNTFLNQAPTRAAEAFKLKQEAEANLGKATEEFNVNPTQENHVKLTNTNKAYKDAQTNTQLSNTLNALHLDYITGKSTAFESHTEQMQGILDAVESNDIAKLKEYNLVHDDGKEKFNGSFDYVKKNFAKDIAESNSIKQMLDNNLTHLTSDFESAWGATKKEYMNRVHTTEIGETEGILQGLYANDTQFSQLTPEGQQKYRNQQELEALNEMNQFKPLSDPLQARAKELTEQLANTNYSAIDKTLVGTLNDFIYKKGELAKIAAKEQIANNNKDLVDLKNPKKIKENIESRVKERAQQATSKEELQQVATEAAEANMTSSIQNTLNEAQQRIIAEQQAAELEAQQQQTSNKPLELNEQDQKAQSTIVGNGSLFGEEMSDVTVFEPIVEDRATKAANVLASPGAVNKSELTDEKKDKLKRSVGSMLEQMTPSATFEDLVRNFIIEGNKLGMNGRAMGDQHFNVLKEGWLLNNKPQEDFQKIYNNVFSNPVLDIIGLGIIENEQVTNEAQDKQGITAQTNITQVETKVLEHNIGEPTVVSDGSLGYVINSNPLLSAPVLSTYFDLNGKSVNEVGTTQDSPNKSLIDSRPLLHPDLFLEGTALSVEVPTNFMGITINTYNEDGSKTGSMTFGEYVAENKLTPDMQEYKDKLPMIVYRQNRTADEKGLAFVHDASFYGISKEDTKEHTRKIREAVHANNKNNKPTSITITGKRTTNFDAFKTPVIGKTSDGRNMYQFIPFTEGNPEARFVVGDKGNVLRDADKIFEDGNNLIQRDENATIKQGHLYELRRAGWKDGKKTWNLLEITPQPISVDVKYTILGAMNVYLNRNNTNPATRKTHDEIAAQVLAITGLDIKNTENFRDYLKQFINVKGSNDDFEKADHKDTVTNLANSVLTQGSTNVGYIHVQQGGTVYIGATRTNAYAGAGQTLYANTNPGSFNERAVKSVLEYLNKKYIGSGTNARTILDTFTDNYSPLAAKANKPVAFINKDGKVIKKADSYQEYARTAYNTNVKAINVAEEGQPPVYASSSVAINYDLTSETKTQPQPTTAQIVEQAAPIVAPIQEGNAISDVEIELMRQASEALGIDFDNYTNFDNLASVAAMSVEQRKQFNQLNTRVVGLEPQEDYQLNDFMFNQIGPILDQKGTITDQEIKATIADVMDNVLDKIKAERTALLKTMEDAIAKAPELGERKLGLEAVPALKKEIARMNALQTPRNLDVLFETAKARLGTVGIKETKTDETKDSADESYTDQNEEERESWQIDSLSLDPNAKTSARLRRFYSSIPVLDKDGKPKKGVFGLPTYYSLEEVGTLTKALLADEAADFKTMLDKLATGKDKYPWMQQLIDKLQTIDKQTQMQFVSDNAMSSLRLKFVMVLFDNKTSSYKTKMWDANQGGVIDQILSNWATKFANSNLILPDTDDAGALIINKIKAQSLIDRFNQFIGLGGATVESSMEDFRARIGQIKEGGKTIISPTKGSALYNELQTKLVRQGQSLKYNFSNARAYQIVNKGDNRFEVSPYKIVAPTKEAINDYLKEFGINLHPKALEDLMTNGLVHNYKTESFEAQFGKGGLFGSLNASLQFAVSTATNEDTGKSPLNEGVVKSLAALEYKYNSTIVPVGGFANGKNFYAITQNKFATERALALTKKDSKVKEQLDSLSFSKHSLWLELLNDDKFKENFAVSHVAFNAMQILGKAIKDDAGINQLSSLDYEVASLGGFWHSEQGEVDKTYRGTDIKMRMATMLMPTMSDKQTGLWIKTAVLSLQNKDLGGGTSISEDVKTALFEQMVLPELERMISFYKKGGKTNIKGYDKGAGMFMMLPKLNTVEYKDELTLVEAIKRLAPTGKLTVDVIKSAPLLMGRIKEAISQTVMSLQKEQLAEWERMGIVESKDGKVNKINYIDSKYLSKFTGSLQEKANMAVLDSVVNHMIHLSNSFMVFAGDPALYFKSGEKQDYTQMAIDSFVNVGKRLANQIAPGIKLANSKDEQYLHVFLEDRLSITDKVFTQHVTKIMDGKAISDEDYEFIKQYRSNTNRTTEDVERASKITKSFPKAGGFFEIEGSNAQEYTTWQEHLNILEKLGRHPDIISDVTADDIAYARKLFGSDKANKDLTPEDKAIIGLVMQPLKPVVTGQQYDETQDVMRSIYIKTSSYPLIPQLTEGFEIDKLRKSLETLSRTEGVHVRASYQSGNKVGAMNNAKVIWDADGRANSNIAPEILKESSLRLDRKNFRIQQDVPFKSGKNNEDKVTMGTQLMKLLFGNDVMSFSGFDYQGQKLTGAQLHGEFSRLHVELVELKKTQLHEELGLNNDGRPIDYAKSMRKIQDLLISEGKDRGFPKQVLDGLVLQGEGDNTEFTLPLWSSINSNKFENLLNAIVTNRVSKVKFPGNSYIAGSSEGYKVQSLEAAGTPRSQMVFTDSWDGDSLKASYYDNGKVKKVQVMVASKFRDSNGKLINLLDDEWSTEVDGKRVINKDKFDAALFNLTSFRIPTTAISSASQIEIVGFLPHTNGDLMLLPNNLVQQKGLDFDIDKETTYQYHHILNNGKFERLSDANKTAYLDQKFGLADETGMMADVAEQATPEYSEADLQDKKGKKYANDFKSKVLQNKIVEIYESVLSNPDPKLQAKINSVLNTDFMEAEARFIESATPKDITNWTPLSQQYQKGKIALGSAGKIGTGAYAMDVVFHSLAQQANAVGKAMELTSIVTNEEGKQTTKKVDWRFGTLDKGGIQSDGILGRIETLDGDRTTSDVLNEVAQIAVDNEKLQIMGKVNLNDLTLDVHKVFNLLGFDKFKTKDKHSVSFLFMSQPILREYVERIGNANSMLNTSYDADRNNKVVTELLLKYYPEIETAELDNSFFEGMADLMGEQNMSDAIASTSPETTHGKLQAGILMRFKEMESYGLALRSVQTTLNVDSKGLGKSFFDVVQKKEKIDGLGNGSLVKSGGNTIGQITNVKELVGDYRLKKESEADAKALKAQGYYDMGDYLVKPNTYIGAFNIITTHTAYNAWKDFMPFDSTILNDIYKELLPIVQSDPSANSTRTIELKQDILGEFKKYVATLPQAGFTDIDDNTNEERRRLYIDTETNTSLATYIQELLDTVGNPVVDSFIKSNKLFNSLKIEPSKVGQPSLIKFNNTKGESFDEDRLYEALSGLMEVRGKEGVLTLPDSKKGDKHYTLDTLAQDMINYAMLGNAKQEAIQFTKYIPVQYLNQVGYSFMMRNLHNKLTGRASEDAIGKLKMGLGLVMKTKETAHFMSEFTTQYIQHNPELVKASIDSKNAKKKLILVKGTKNEYVFDDESRPPFIKIYDPYLKSKKKFKLYKYNGQTYNQIPILGVFGMDEYNFGAGVNSSIVNEMYQKPKNGTEPSINPSQSTQPQELKSGDSLKNTIEAMAKAEGKYQQLAQALLPSIGANKVELVDYILRNNKPDYEAYGGYDVVTGGININRKILNNPELLARTLLHEAVHGLTHSKVKDWIVTGTDGFAKVKENAPQYVRDLAIVFNKVRATVSSIELESFNTKLASEEGVSQEELSNYYGLTSVDEFMTMALTDIGFQQKLNSIKYMGEMSLLDKFKSLVQSILTSIGIEFKADYTAAHAISTIFEVIKADDKQDNNDFQEMFFFDDQASPNYNDNPWGNDDAPNEQPDVKLNLYSLAATSYPDTKFEIGNTEC